VEEKSMSKVEGRNSLKGVLDSKDKVFVLFYAPWCPFCQRFLPAFAKFSQDKTRKCAKIEIDDNEGLCEKYSVDVVPTVLVFENGKLVKRLDGLHGIGLSEKQLIDFAKTC
jgi:thiol-disulfide isomerase/thioredoxin